MTFADCSVLATHAALALRIGGNSAQIRLIGFDLLASVHRGPRVRVVNLIKGQP